MNMFSGNLPTIAIVSHGKCGWKWVLLDWGILIADGYEQTKTAARAKAREMQKQKFNQTQIQ